MEEKAAHDSREFLRLTSESKSKLIRTGPNKLDEVDESDTFQLTIRRVPTDSSEHGHSLSISGLQKDAARSQCNEKLPGRTNDISPSSEMPGSSSIDMLDKAYRGPAGGLVGSTVRVSGMLRSDLNDREGFAEAFNTAINRYKVRFSCGESRQLLASQLIQVNDLGTDAKQAIGCSPPAMVPLSQPKFSATKRWPPPPRISRIYVAPSQNLQQAKIPMELPVPDPKDLLANTHVFKDEGRAKTPQMCGDHTLEEYMGDEGSGERLAGTLLWFDQTKQYGFISPENGHDNYFLHGIDIYDQVHKGQKVQFEHGTDVSGRKKACMVTPWGCATRNSPCDQTQYSSSGYFLHLVDKQMESIPRTISEYYAIHRTV